jgi:hypothetical protein
LQHYTLAAEDCGKAVELHDLGIATLGAPVLAKAHLRHAHALARLGRRDEADAAARHAARILPTSADVAKVVHGIATMAPVTEGGSKDGTSAQTGTEPEAKGKAEGKGKAEPESESEWWNELPADNDEAALVAFETRLPASAPDAADDEVPATEMRAYHALAGRPMADANRAVRARRVLYDARRIRAVVTACIGGRPGTGSADGDGPDTPPPAVDRTALADPFETLRRLLADAEMRRGVAKLACRDAAAADRWCARIEAYGREPDITDNLLACATFLLGFDERAGKLLGPAIGRRGTARLLVGTVGKRKLRAAPLHFFFFFFFFVCC